MNRQRDEEDFRNNLKGIFYHLLEDHQFLPAFLNEAYLGHLKQHTQVLKNDYDNKYFAKIYLETCSEHQNFRALLQFFSNVFFTSQIDGIRLFTRQEYDPYRKIQFFEISLQGCIAFMVHHF